MSRKTLHQLYAEHQGKVSDKWSLYLTEYDRLFDSYRDNPVRLLEIGIQNGGSLDIWSKYFSNASVLIGCDINPDCARLIYDDPRIGVIVGDANAPEVREQVFQRSPQFDIIIDDGSHLSSDIIKSFAQYFPLISEGGVFIAEDLHCSYWGQYEGGLFDPYSSITFFKRLADVINHEHWGIPKTHADVLRGIFTKHDCEIDVKALSQVHSIEFINSMCVIRKAPAADNRLGHRIIAGSTEVVVPGHRDLHDDPYQFDPTLDQSSNPWTVRATPPDEAIQHSEVALANAQEQIASLNQAVTERDSQIASLNQAVTERDGQITALHNSTSWRMTRPLRAFARHLKRVRRVAELAMPAIKRDGGIKNTFRKALRIYRNEGLQGIKRGFRLVAITQIPCVAKDIAPAYLQLVSHPAEKLLTPRVLIVAEMSIPQCKKYRVQQKHDMLKLLGVDCTMLNWNNTQACLDALQTHSLVIFYRVPAFDSVLSIINEAKRLRLPSIWEVDDFIFDKNVLTQSKTLAALDKNVFNQLIEGAELYRKAMLLCDKGIASTTGLADAMKKAGLTEVHVVENALDRQTLEVAEKVCREHTIHQNGIVRIVYGSGTNTHNIDFQEAAPAIIKILGKFPNVRFRLIGILDLPETFSHYEGQVERLPACTYEEYLGSLAECDISIAPLENYIFNDSKSNIKYLEASIVKVPSVCSPRAAFSQVIIHGENGFLCETDEDWEAALTLLVTDTAKRAEISEAAYLSVMRHYSPESIAHQQVAPLLEHHDRNTDTLRVLSVNCLYYPRSFGGATIVAEEVNKRINALNGFEVHVFTALPSSVAPPYTTRRYEADGISVYGVGLPDRLDEKTGFENPEIVDAFANVLAVVQPDIVHFHCIQGIGVSVIDLCIKKDIKYVITLHDAWWLCARQFMINKQGNYCEQNKINLNVCATCVENSSLNLYRSERLSAALHNASALLAPSRFFADFYTANGFANVLVNKNGVIKPNSARRLRREGYLRFGYVGGNTEIKGIHLVKKVFSGLAGCNVGLVLVDNTLNLGYASYHQQDLFGIPNVEIVPAYTQSTIDDFFASIDVLLFPTQCKESFGLTVREAMARNVWVITTDAGGVTEDIEPGRNGYIVPFSDTGEGLKQAVINTLGHFECIRPGEEVSLGEMSVTFFEDQAAELATILKRVVVREALNKHRLTSHSDLPPL